MFGFGHIFDLVVLLALALLVFGPRKMIEMGASLGRSLRELRGQLKDIPGMSSIANMGGLLGDEDPRHTPFSTMSQFAQNMSIEARDAPAAPPSGGEAAPQAPAGAPPTVEGSVASVEEHPAE